ncbi:MAG TPA: GDSL-type esterase/lipase family protein [Leptospiraceae bacterium]|nr:GDSL-type esterase/lipase family protein [Leptospiraceae bacterium]HMX35208.1 GDSL-type esterase/lipase family protein [Leptospiraceae bacterium]HMY29484.1 GDSL-type esterase/lipase family protein [Leptospiraceae bacterium]HMZ63595.1 GDSL-type esterase/lipase family protein [Leptospiraceae bacterium]HNA10255.1 GDSL-type esterase/lipase family protein [Leptospiraceae bacterium]
MTLRNNLFFILFFFLIHCSSFGKVKNDYFDYYDSSFKCLAETGWRDSNLYSRYLDLGWNPIRKKYNDDNQKIKSANVVIVGNSLIQLFDERLIQREFPSLNVVGRGIAGDMSESLRQRISDNVLSLNPKTVIIEIGGNDIIFGKCLSYTENNIRGIIEDIQSYDKRIKIIFLSVPPTKNKVLNSVVPALNASIQSLAKEYNFVYLDLWKAMRNPDLPVIKEDFVRYNEFGKMDKIHFNEKGYEVIGQLVRPLIK